MVAVVLKIVRGYSPEYLLKEVATGRENYYTGAVAAGEPPGRWWGAGAEKLGLRGLVDSQDMRAVYERYLDPRADGFNDPKKWDEVATLGHAGRKYQSEDDLYAAFIEREPDASAERRAELRTEAGKAARHNVAFFDMTFSVQKSVTLLHTAFEAEEMTARNSGDEETAAAWGEFRCAVEDAIWAGNNAGLAYLQDKAGYTRVGHHGGAAGRWADAHGWVVASFFQHDSRDHDPQLHIHNTLFNRVEGPDGTWLTVDGRSLFRWRPAGAAVAERTTAERLTHSIGVLIATRPDGKAREIVGVSAEAMDLISTRRHKVTAKAAELIAAHEARTGTAANGLVRERLTQQATLLTRAAKSHTGETREELLSRVDERIRADIAGGLAGIAQTALAARDHAPVARDWSPQAVIETALADVQGRKAGWTEADLISAIDAALPDHIGTAEGARIGALLDQLAAEAVTYATSLDAARPGDEQLPSELRLANGDSALQAPGSRLYATPEQVRTERALVAATTSGAVAALPYPVAQRFLADLAGGGIELGADQAAAVRGVLTSGAQVETLVGPAGTGKSFVVGAMARAWTDPTLTGGPQRRVFGLATSQIATEVLASEGLTARNVAGWLATQGRLADHAGPADEDQAWRLHAGDLVVVDEAAMTDTAALAAIYRHVEQAGAKLLLVGDHRQLAAVGAGGGMGLLAQSGASYELVEARRFTHEWERDASLRLRVGDQTVLRDYHRQGRLLDSGTTEQAEQSAARAWLADTLAGKRSLLVVDTNEQAARLSAHIRNELVQLGRVEEGGIRLGLQGTYAGIGDVVEARQIDWTLTDHDGTRRGVLNRERFIVESVRDDGSLEVTPLAGCGRAGERVVLPAKFVGEHLALGYASTVNAAQGSTIDTTHTVVTFRTRLASLYVGLTRGRDENTAHIATVAGVEDPAQGSDRHTVRRDPVAALARVLDNAAQDTTRSATSTAAESADAATNVRTAVERLADAAHRAATERTAGWLDQLTAAGVLTGDERARIAAEDGAASLTRVLRRAELAGHDPAQVLHDAIADRPFDGARNLSNVIHGRIRADQHDRLDPTGETYTEWTPRVDNPEWSRFLSVLADTADRRAEELGEQLADDPPPWVVDALGPVPVEGEDRDRWTRDAGRVAAYRELRGHDDPAEALGPAPQPGQPEQYAAYRAAWRTLGRPDVDAEELGLSDGQLRVRIRAGEREQTWAPRYVANELAGTRQAAATQRQNAALRVAEADAAHDPDDRERLHREAAEAAALADTLDGQATELQLVDDARADWLLHTSGTRVRADRAKAELVSRHADDTEPEERVTAEEWFDAHRQADAEDDQHRVVTEADVDERQAVEATPKPTAREDDVAELAEPDIRDTAAAEPAPVREDVVRVPSADESADSVDAARRAMAEVHARDVADREREAEERAVELARWHDDDQATEHSADDAMDQDLEPEAVDGI